jgi:HEAT repeat protein
MRRRTVMILVGVLALGGLGASLVAVFKPFEPGARYKGLPVSYWKRAVKEYLPVNPQSLTSRLGRFLGLRGKSGASVIFRFDAAAIPVLLDLRTCGDRHVKLVISEQVMLASVSPPGKEITADFVNAIVDQLQNENREIRRAAAELLNLCTKNATTEAIGGLTSSLEDEDEGVRGWAARTLGEIGPQAAPAIPSLIRLLKDKALAEEAAEALRQIDPEAAERARVK